MAAKKKVRKALGKKALKKTRGGALKSPGGASYALPEVNDEVIVAFEAGDFKKPVVIGSLWQSDKPPESKK